MPNDYSLSFITKACLYEDICKFRLFISYSIFLSFFAIPSKSYADIAIMRVLIIIQFFYNRCIISFIMPLVVMCGVPGSGKTFRANQLKAYLESKHNQKVVIINEQGLGIQKNKGYVNAQSQKITRGRIKFEVQKNLVGNTVVIVDSSNFIKGYRYQMYCIAREQKTTYCVIFCNTEPERCKQFNAKNQNKFSDELLEDLFKRMQRPELKNRWDVPLFERRDQQPTPLEQITDVLLFQQKKSKDPVSTKQDEKLSQDYLLELDQIMQQVNKQALQGKIKFVNTWSAVELKNLKKSFTNIAKERPQSLKVLKQAYMDYIIEADKRK